MGMGMGVGTALPAPHPSLLENTLRDILRLDILDPEVP